MHGEPNTYGLPTGAEVRTEVRHWAAKQRAAVLRALGQVKIERKGPPVAPIPDAFPDLTAPQWVDPMAAAMTPILETYWDLGGKETLARLGLDPAKWEVTNPHLSAAIKAQSLAFCKATNETTSLQLDKALTELKASLHAGIVDHGETLKQLTERVEAIFTGLDTYRAERIAVDQASRSVHAAQERADVESGVVAGLEILLSSDACALCRRIAIEVKQVRLGQDFAVIGSHPEYSRKRTAPFHVHCQCTCIEVLKPEYGGPDDPVFGETLVQPQMKGWEPPTGVKAPKPAPEKLKDVKVKPPKPKPKPVAPEPVVPPPPPLVAVPAPEPPTPKPKRVPKPKPEPALPSEPGWKPRKMGEFRTIGAAKDQEAWGEKQSRAWADSLSDTEKGAIRMYASDEYKWINAYLRGDKSKVPEYAMDPAVADRYIDRITNALAHGKTTEPVAVYRGVKDYSHMGIDPRTMKPGEEVRIKSFASATLSESKAHDFAINEGGDRCLLVKINMPAGSTGGYLNAAGLSQYDQEREFLMPPGTKYRFVKHGGEITNVWGLKAQVIVLERVE